jgi:hypothetical protein
VAEGFHGAHCRANGHAAKTLETAAFLYALIELLSEKGVVAIDELDERKRAAFARQKQRYAKDRMGVILQDSQIDKYAFERTTEIDCASRVHLCKASCCRLPFALSRQDVEERVVRWDFGVPYMIEQGADRLLQPPRPLHPPLHHLPGAPRPLPRLRLPQRCPHLARFRATHPQPGDRACGLA